jgi:hypothetical protein
MSAELTTSAGGRTLVTGKHIHLRTAQMVFWSVIAAVLGAGFVAGLYFGILQVDWHVHVGSVNFQLFYLKKWWDSGMGVTHSGNWVLYRHAAFRDIAEPALATMAVLTLLAKPRWWGVRVGTLRLVTAPVILIAATFAMGILGVWLLDFGFPAAWHHVFGSHVLPLGFLGKASAGTLILGFLIGRVLHRWWAPVGATLQGHLLDRSADRAHRNGRTPLWVKLPIAPPVIRERFSLMYRDDEEIRDVGTVNHWLILAIVTVFVLVTALGLAGHYWVGTLNQAIPYLAP